MSFPKRKYSTNTGTKPCQQNKKLTIGAIYCPIRYNLNKKITDTPDTLTRKINCWKEMTDFNSIRVDWGSRLTTTTGNKLRKPIQEIGASMTQQVTLWILIKSLIY